MSLRYVIRRLGLLVVVMWAAGSLNFFLPRLASGRDPIREKMAQLAASGGLRQDGIEAMVAAYRARFGLDRPLYEQYLNYLGDMVRLDFGYSLANYPIRVSQMIGNALPWTIGLLVVTTLVGFAVGTLLGALVAWPGSPRWMRGLAVPLMTLSAIPYYLLGLILLFLLGLQLELFPLSGGYSPGTLPALRPAFILDVLHHAALPALSIVLAAIGLWGMGMRGMMVTTVGEDYIALARANGVRDRTIFLRYAVRNALLPQLTALGLSLAYVVTGQVLVEVVFAFPGVGSLLFKAIQVSDFTVINGVVFLTILSIALITTLLDLAYPFLDPRITHHQEAVS